MYLLFSTLALKLDFSGYWGKKDPIVTKQEPNNEKKTNSSRSSSP